MSARESLRHEGGFFSEKDFYPRKKEHPGRGKELRGFSTKRLQGLNVYALSLLSALVPGLLCKTVEMLRIRSQTQGRESVAQSMDNRLGFSILLSFSHSKDTRNSYQ